MDNKKTTEQEQILPEFDTTLIAPFPYFGGKRKIASVVWEYLGDPKTYIEPFFGSGAVLGENCLNCRQEKQYRH